MFELIVIIIICIAIWKLWIGYTNHLREQKNRPIMEQREENLHLLIEDVLATVDRVAPNFKYITIYASYTRNSDDKHFFEIQNEKNETLRYNYKAHGFDPGDEAKKQLAMAIAQKYGGRWVEHQRDISQDRHASWVIDNYQVIAHEGLREIEEEKRRKDSIRKC
ncbi:hypothetical protein B5F12_05405 [Pseudoflavonifractor sp. An176]|uniref:hypothetical protein n=1 Tax=Pseudoflavonifractor sp. An176 TaxID=1965572 RepID=UPI000B3A095B|nr:hypothetical protein [Pseudoflavonifractor sp. An176]OUP64484.1 hypothetical protein B5F12_05405 [Pseudoflavonifractor sp. An176]